MAAPLKKFVSGAVQVSVWENQPHAEDGTAYHTVSIDKRYKAKDNSWKSSNTLKVNDIPRAVLALQKAYEYLALKEPLQCADASARG